MASSSSSALLRRTVIASSSRHCASTSSAARLTATAQRHNSTSTSESSSASSPRPLPPLSKLTSRRGREPAPPSRIKPTTPTFFTAKPTYISLVLKLQSLLEQSRSLLQSADILPRDAKPPTPEEAALYEAQAEVAAEGGDVASVSMAKAMQKVQRQSPWKKRVEMSEGLGLTLSASQYRQLATSLTTLSRYNGLVQLHFAGNGEAPTAPHLGGAAVDQGTKLAQEMQSTLDEHRRDLGLNARRGDGFTTKSGVDEQGRIWAVGGRKDSSARVWIAPVSQATSGAEESQLPVGDILINGSPLSTYFTRQSHRESIVHPLRLVGLVGQFNIFALTSGGGHSGQAGAIAHSLSKCVVRYFEEKVAAEEEGSVKREEWEKLRASVRSTLAKDGVYKRDPRMVERKKTGLAKARKAYTWVKR